MSADEALDGVAIVGMALRVPGADDADALWQNLAAGVDCLREATDEELLAAGVPPERLRDPRFVRRWGFLRDVDRFDPGAFGMTRREAELTDPQQRLLLECAAEALASASPGGRGRNVGVYAGVGFNHYLLTSLLPALQGASAPEQYRLFLGSDKDFAAARVAYALDLTGPAMTIQTACSTSLVAVCTAALHLLTRQCDLALAGGASVRLPQGGYLYDEGMISSPDGRCRAFDADARGTAWGNGAGVVALKRLEDALADGDPVWAVIKGFAVNNDGRAKATFTAPSVDGQADVIARALAMAGFDPRSVGYVEAHGTATPLGDPIEVAALTRAFRQAAGGELDGAGWCALGSIKTNVGHLDCAAGVAGLIKTALAVHHGQIPPSLHFARPNPAIDFASSPFFVSAALSPWAAGATPRRAGVSAFGVGGTNAHVVLEAPPPATRGALRGRPSPAPTFQRQRCWVDARSVAHEAHALHGLAWQAVATPPARAEGPAVLVASSPAAPRVSALLRAFERAGVQARVAAPSEDGSLPPAAIAVVFWPSRGAAPVDAHASRTIAAGLRQLQSWLREGGPRRLVWMTERSQLVAAGEVPSPSHAGLWGLGRTFQSEHPDRPFALIDLDGFDEPRGDDLLSALSAPDPCLALREGRCHAPHLTALPARRVSSLGAGDGAVLITGGLGALGLRVASHLATRHGVRRLVLVGRGAPDEAQRAAVAAIEAQGAAVTVATLDVADRDALARLLDAHPVRGVVHAAGVLDDATVEGLDGARLERVLRPKVQGAWNLHALTEAMPLDCFVLFSSIASVIGPPGQGAYAAANAFLDALALHRRARALPGLSLAWGPWEGLGMSARLRPEDRARRDRAGLTAVAPEEALALFDAALAEPSGFAVECAPSFALAAGRAPEAPAPSTGAESLRPLQPTERLQRTREHVRAAVARGLGRPASEVPVDVPLAALGADSLMAVELRSALSTWAGRPLPGALLVDQPTVEAIASALSGLLGEGAERATAAASHTLCRLHPEPPNPPLFLVGGAVGGDPLYLRDLARALGPMQPSYGLLYPGTTRDEAPLDDVGALAEHFLGELRGVAPDGPFVLAGHSMGGLVAFEMATRLSARGRCPMELILLDAPLFAEGAELGALAGLWRDTTLRQYLDRIAEMNWLSDDPDLLAQARGASGEAWQLMERSWRASLDAALRYRPGGTYPGEATFVTPQDDRAGLSVCVEAWRARCPALKVARTSGNHISMVRGGHARKTARVLRRLFGSSDLDEF